jgi:hypothetical protein
MMLMKQLKLLLLVCMLSPAFAYAQKAYEAFEYRGKVQAFNIHFTLADGYLGACEIRATDVKTHKRSSFLPEYGYADEHKNLIFYRRNGGSKTDYFIISGMEELFETPPAKIKGTYYIKDKAYPFILKR